MSGALLARILRDPAEAAMLAPADWTGLLTAARAERLLGTLAARLEALPVPGDVAPILVDARLDAARERRLALWEVDRALVALAPLRVPVVLLKGSAFVAAGLDAGIGRAIGDLDILVPREALDDVEAALLGAGWEWVKPDPYDDAYYRRWMHELPPLIHRERDRMIDVHHTILPLTARPTPDAGAMIADSVRLESGAHILSREDMLVHAAAHLIADGDLAGGLRNLWDIDRLCRQFLVDEADFCLALYERAAAHGLLPAVTRALRLAWQIFDTPVASYRQPIRVSLDSRPSDGLFRARLLARDGWGRPTRRLLGQGFYIRSHLLRMPPAMLARHLWTKWRKGYRPPG